MACFPGGVPPISEWLSLVGPCLARSRDNVFSAKHVYVGRCFDNSFSQKIILTKMNSVSKITANPVTSFSRLLPYYFLAAIVTAAFGAELSEYFPAISPGFGALQMLLMAGSGWVLLSLMSFVRLSNWGAYWEQLGKIMLIGVSLLLPFILLQLSVGVLPYWLPILSVLLSSLTMLGFHVLAVSRLQLSGKWNWAWFFALQITATFWILIFHY